MIDTPHRKALAFSSDANGLPFALFAAKQAAQLSANRDFDILICSLVPLDIPQHFLDLGITPVVLDLSETLAAQGFDTTRLPLEVYLWLWLPRALGDIYDRMLCLDSDIYLLTHDLSDFIDFDLGPHAIGGVRDITQWDRLSRPVEEFKTRGMGGLKYLNTGVILINTARYNSCGILDDILAVHADNRAVTQHDQSLLNLVVKGEWAELNPVWNWQWARSYPAYTDYAGVHIIHFQGRRKPWDSTAHQALFPRIFVNEYKVFLDAYFPAQSFDVLPVAAFQADWRQTIRGIFDHLLKIPHLYLLLRKFKSDRDVHF